MRAWPRDRAVTADIPSPGAARRVVIGALLLALVPACSGGNDDTTLSATAFTAPMTTAPVVTTPPAPPTALATEPTPTTQPSTTAATPLATVPPVTGAPSSSVLTVPASTATVLTDEELALAVVAGSYRVWIECIRSISTCDTSTFAEFVTEPQLSGDIEQIAEAQRNGWEVENADSLTYEVLEVDLEHTIPHVIVCQRDEGRLVERKPGEPERALEEGYLEKVREAHLVRSGDGWSIEGFAAREESPERGALCG